MFMADSNPELGGRSLIRNVKGPVRPAGAHRATPTSGFRPPADETRAAPARVRG